jgi:hypothetical protein
MLVALTADGAERESDLGEVTNNLSTCRPGERRDPHNHQRRLPTEGLNPIG